jgi:hypothetical protein
MPVVKCLAWVRSFGELKWWRITICRTWMKWWARCLSLRRRWCLKRWWACVCVMTVGPWRTAAWTWTAPWILKKASSAAWARAICPRQKVWIACAPPVRCPLTWEWAWWTLHAWARSKGSQQYNCLFFLNAKCRNINSNQWQPRSCSQSNHSIKLKYWRNAMEMQSMQRNRSLNR